MTSEIVSEEIGVLAVFARSGAVQVTPPALICTGLDSASQEAPADPRSPNGIRTRVATLRERVHSSLHVRQAPGVPPPTHHNAHRRARASTACTWIDGHFDGQVDSEGLGSRILKSRNRKTSCSCAIVRRRPPCKVFLPLGDLLAAQDSVATPEVGEWVLLLRRRCRSAQSRNVRREPVLPSRHMM